MKFTRIGRDRNRNGLAMKTNLLTEFLSAWFKQMNEAVANALAPRQLARIPVRVSRRER